MAAYIQLQFSQLQQEQIDVLIARLSEAGFEGFEEQDTSLLAFVSQEAFDPVTVTAIAKMIPATYTTTSIQETNWNQLWESNFDPVIVGNFAGIRAGFHVPILGVKHELVITPKMSFGTGHHATTYMMVAHMQEVSFEAKSVFDFGTGTGLLAILAEKLGAAAVTAIDNDEWSIENARENITNNRCSNIELFKADTASLNKKFDIILANINKNVILENLAVLFKQLNKGGVLFLSGLLQEDERNIRQAIDRIGEYRITTDSRGSWLFLKVFVNQ